MNCERLSANTQGETIPRKLLSANVRLRHEAAVKKCPLLRTVPPSSTSRALILGSGWTATANRAICELVRLAARLIIEEGLEPEATDALGRSYYARGAARKRTWLADL